jgi:hypothetical protein
MCGTREFRHLLEAIARDELALKKLAAVRPWRRLKVASTSLRGF